MDYSLYPNLNSPYPDEDSPVEVVEAATCNLTPRPWDTAIEVFGRYYARLCYNGRNGWILSPFILKARHWDEWLVKKAVEDFQNDFPTARLNVYQDIRKGKDGEPDYDQSSTCVMAWWSDGRGGFVGDRRSRCLVPDFDDYRCGGREVSDA